MTRNPEDTEYGRCEATAKSSGEQCGRAAVGDHGKCDFHGGKSPKGEDHPSFEHGLFSDHLSEEDREAAQALDDVDNAEKLEELINWRLVRLRRYLREKNDAEKESFFDKFDKMVQEGRKNGEPGLSAKQIKELAKALSMNNRAAQQEIDLVRKLIKAHDKIDGDGGGVGGLRDLFGGGDE